MTEVAFPLLGAAFVVLIVLPVLALLAKAGLVLLERDEVGGPLHGSRHRLHGEHRRGPAAPPVQPLAAGAAD